MLKQSADMIHVKIKYVYAILCEIITLIRSILMLWVNRAMSNLFRNRYRLLKYKQSFDGGIYMNIKLSYVGLYNLVQTPMVNRYWDSLGKFNL